MIPRITIIMPSLNVADYIRQCVESVQRQTLKEIEVLVVDAGSTDGTLEILRGYEQKDPRIKIIRSEKKSYGYQLNRGIALARGQYVGIVETDDIAEPDLCERLYEAARETGADYVKGTAEGFFSSLTGEELRYPMKVFTQEEYNGCGGTITVVPRKTPELVLKDYYVWDGIYRREFIQGIRLNESGGAAFQDIGFMAQVHLKAEKAVYLDRLIYHYRRNSLNSSCGSKNTNAFRYLVQEYEYVDTLIRGRSEEWQRVMAQKMFRQTMVRFRLMARNGEFWEASLQDMERLGRRVETAVSDGILTSSSLTEIEWYQAMCLCASPKLLYEACEKAVHDKIKAVQDIIDGMCDRQAVIFGCGRLGRYLQILLGNQKPGQIAAYCDNQCGETEESVQGIKVFKPEEAVLKYPGAVYIIANRLHGDEMKSQLRSYGIGEEDIYIYAGKRDWMLVEKYL